MESIGLNLTLRLTITALAVYCFKKKNDMILSMRDTKMVLKSNMSKIIFIIKSVKNIFFKALKIHAQKYMIYTKV